MTCTQRARTHICACVSWISAPHGKTKYANENGNRCGSTSRTHLRKRISVSWMWPMVRKSFIPRQSIGFENVRHTSFQMHRHSFSSRSILPRVAQTNLPSWQVPICLGENGRYVMLHVVWRRWEWTRLFPCVFFVPLVFVCVLQ